MIRATACLNIIMNYTANTSCVHRIIRLDVYQE